MKNIYRWSALALMTLAGASLMTTTSASAKNDDDDRGERNQNAIGQSHRVVIHIEGNDRALVRGAIVKSIASSTIQASTLWGNGSIEWRVRTDTNTEFLKRHGGHGMRSDISVGDTISFQGRITEEGPMPTVLASAVKNWSIEKTRGRRTGVIHSLNATSSHFTMSVSGNGTYDIAVSSTTEIRKGTSTIAFASLAVGNEAKIEGILNTEAHTIAAERIEVKMPLQSQNLKLRTIFEGTVTTPPASTTPTSLKARISSRDMSVDIGSATLLVNRIWRRIVVGDIRTDHKIQMYGASDVDDTSILDVTLLRDLSL